MTKKLNEKQIAAIAILSQPKRGGLTYEQIAEEVVVARSTLFEWKKNDDFHNALKAEIVRTTSDRLPEVFASMIDNIVETGNAAAFRTLMQLHGLLTEKVDINSTGGKTDIADIKAEIERLRKVGKSE